MVRRKMWVALLGAVLAVGSVVLAHNASAIVGGTQASENYSFLAYVPAGCSGTLIKSDWVATAAHCPNPSSVRFGIDQRNMKVAFVDQVVRHPSEDLMLLRLSEAVPNAPVPIADRPPLINNVLRSIGWGQTCPAEGCGSIPVIAREVNNVVTFENRCQNIDGTNELCIETTAGSGPCFGDSGGPMVRQTGGRWVLYGIVAGSARGNCGTLPTVGVDMAIMKPWISSTVGGGLPA